MKTLIKSPWLAGVLGTALLVLGGNASAGVIDEFTTAQPTVVSFGSPVASFAGTAGDTSILGGFRNLYAEALTGFEVNEVGTRIGVAKVAGLDRLAFSNDSGVRGYGEIVWQGDNEYGTTKALVETGLGGIDITAGGTLSAFLIETISSDANWNFEIYAYSDAANYTRINLAATEVPTGTGPSLNTIPFAAFTDFCPAGIPFPGLGAVNEVQCVGGGVDLTNLGALRVVLNTGADGSLSGGAFDIDLRLGSVTTVPEPATLTLMGLGLLAAGALGMRRKDKMGA